MKPIWAKIKDANVGKGIIFVEVDEDQAHTPGITSYPTILMLDEHGRTLQYKGGPDPVALQKWATTPHH